MGGNAGGTIGAIGGGILGGLSGVLGNQPGYTRPDGRTAPIGTQYNNILNSLSGDFLSYDQLVALGRMKAGTPSWFTGGESKVSKLLGGYESSLFAADPRLATYASAIGTGLEGLEKGGIPGDLRRSITEELRQSQAARGILDSPTASTEEVVRLMGGEERIRAERLAQAQDYFNTIVAPGLRSIVPGMGDLLSGSLGTAGLNLRRGEDIISARGQYNNMAFALAGAGLGLGAGSSGGGGSAAGSGGMFDSTGLYLG